MKQKLFTILTLLLCLCSTAWATDPFFSMNASAVTSTVSGTANSTVSVGSPAVISGGSVTYTCTGSNARDIMKTTNSKGFFTLNKDSYFTITLNEEMAVGDVIKIGTYSSGSARTYNFDATKWDEKAASITGVNTSGITEKEYTIQASDEFVGSTTLYINNNNNSSQVFFQYVTITHASGGGGSKTETSRVLTGINISGSAWDISGLSDNAATVTTAYDHVPTVQFVYTINYDDSSSDTGQTEDAVPAKSGDNYVTTSTELTTNVTLTFTNVTNQFLFKMTDVTGVSGTVGDNIDSAGKVIKSKSATVEASFNNVGGTSAIVYNGGGSNAALVDQYHQINLGNSGNSYFKASFATPLEAGDIITCSSEGKTFYINATSSKSSSVVTLPYTVTSSDALVSTTDVYVWKDNRSGAENPGNTFTSFTIKRNTKHTVTYAAGEGSGDVPASFEWPEEGKFTVASGDNLTPPANKVFDCWNDGSNDYAAGATYTMGTSNVTLTAKYKDPNVLFAAGEGSGTMAAQAHDAGDIFNLPNSTFTVPTDCKFVNWLCSVDGQTYDAGAPYTMTNAVTTFTAQYESILGTMLIKAVLTGSTTATITGSVGGTYSGNTHNVDANVGGCKLGSKGTWTGFTLTEGHTLKAGDIVEVKITQRNGSTPFVFYDSKLQTNTLLTTTVNPEPGTYKFVLPEAANGKNGVFLVRGKDNDSNVGSANQGFNPHVEYMSVTRPNSTITLNASGFATFSNAEDFKVVGADAYKMALTTTATTINLAGTKVTDAIPAGNGILFKGTAGDLVAIVNTTGAPAITGNNLHATTTATQNVVDVPAGKTIFVLDPSGDTFKRYTEASFVANKAYFQMDGTNVESRTITMTFDDGSTTTAINGIEDVAPKTTKTRKVVKNGRLVIETANGEFTIDGAKIK